MWAVNAACKGARMWSHSHSGTERQTRTMRDSSLKQSCDMSQNGFCDRSSSRLPSTTVHISIEHWTLAVYTGPINIDILGTYFWTPYIIIQHATFHVHTLASQAVPQVQSIPEERMQYRAWKYAILVCWSRILILTCLSISSIFAAVDMHPNVTICCTSCLRVNTCGHSCQIYWCARVLVNWTGVMAFMWT